MKTVKIRIPKGKKVHHIIVATPRNGYIEVSYELRDLWTPKDGDFIFESSKFGTNHIGIYKAEDGLNNREFHAMLLLERGCVLCKVFSYTNDKLIFRPATEEEKQQLLDALHNDGKDWDAVNKKIVPYWWKPNEGDCYYYVTDWMSVDNNTWDDDILDSTLYNRHNCFRTKEEAEAMRDRLQKVLNGAKLKGE